MDSYSRALVDKFLKEKGCENFGTEGDKIIWVKDDVLVIQIPSKGRIDYDEFEFIATEQLGIGYWEFDYWLGENA
jgi:hypothetical protein